MSLPPSLVSTPKLYGHALVLPVVSYHYTMTQYYPNECGCKSVAYGVAHFVSGLFCYTLLGLFALIGLIVKKCDAWKIDMHNEGQISNLQKEFNRPRGGLVVMSGANEVMRLSGSIDCGEAADHEYQLNDNDDQSKVNAAIAKMREATANFRQCSYLINGERKLKVYIYERE